MSKRSSKKHQKIYRMKGCSKTRKNYLGGNNLAYPSNNVPKVPNPFLAYNGKGGANLDSAYPNQGPAPSGFNFLNPLGSQKGGNCGCGLPLMKGGCGPLCAAGLMMAGGKHRRGCKCSICKTKKNTTKRSVSGGNKGISYPDGLVGKSWTPSVSGWPGVDNISGGRNHLANNNFHTDISRQMVATGANRPFSVGGGKRKQKGGTLSNFIGQDLINLGRQFQFGLGSAYNAISGYPAPINPMPWKGQLPRTPDLSTLKAAI